MNDDLTRRAQDMLNEELERCGKPPVYINPNGGPEYGSGWFIDVPKATVDVIRWRGDEAARRYIRKIIKDGSSQAAYDHRFTHRDRPRSEWERWLRTMFV